MRSVALIVILAITLAYISQCEAADSNIRYKDMPVSPPSVPSVAPSGAYSDICVVGASGGISAGFLGISGGSHIVDEFCQRIKLSRSLAQMGLKISATALLCQDARVFEAMIAAGSPCPVNGLIGKEAIIEYRKRGILDEENNIIRNPMSRRVKFNVDKPKRTGDFGQPTN